MSAKEEGYYQQLWGIYISRLNNNRRRYWVHPLHQTRPSQGAWHTCMAALRDHYPEKHREALRMDLETFNEILDMVGPSITKQDTFFRKAISPDQRLGVTLYYLATGDSFPTIALLFRLGRSTTRAIIFETCHAIWRRCNSRFLKTPTTTEEWKKVVADFETIWQFPHNLEAIDEKHRGIQCPKTPDPSA